MENGLQILSLEERKRLTLTCVQAVDSFTEEKIRLKVKTGSLVVTGEKLKINAFSESTGAFSCEGIINSLSFAEKKENLVKRIFR
ncbi:MAG: YabP/YqfC family sporulation protein [Clostridia bacterium]|nr:YabP/YqfC family sporulation protein [Clostridia bacterium]MBQ9480992.1 YabP/YqfC family sporulation protein [Clostridia bacterium]